MQIEIHDHVFEMFPQKAVFWKNTNTLLISDLHLGKITHFRKEGIAVPSNAFGNNFSRLDELMGTTNAERIILLGDLFHNRHNEEWNRFEAWRKKYMSAEIIIVLGNHDILPRSLYDGNQMIVLNEMREGPFIFSHHPGTNKDRDAYSFCGHVHPVYCLRSKARQQIKLPCFVFDKHEAILPSFGVFTGGFELERIGGRKLFVIAEDKILAINGQ